MPSPAWLNAASATSRNPVFCLSIESVDAIDESIYGATGPSSWGAGTLTNLNANNTDSDHTGALVLETNGLEQTADIYPATTVIPASEGYGEYPTPWVGNYSAVPVSIMGPFAGTATGTNAGANSRISGASFLISFYGAPTGCIIQGSLSGGAWQPLLTCLSPGNGLSQTFSVLTPSVGSWAFRIVYNGTPVVYGINACVLDSYYTSYTTQYLAFGATTTTSVNLGLVPAINSTVNIQALISSIATLAVVAYGSNDNATWTSLGAVIDGSSVAPYQYYRFAVSFASTNGQETPVLQSIGVTGGNTQFKYYSTHPDIPVQGALPYLQGDVGSLTSSIQLMKLGTTGQITPKLFYLPDVFTLLQTGYLRNKAVCLLMGFQGLALGDYEPIFTGLWYDGAIDLTKGVVSVQTRTVFSLFQKVQLPAEKPLNDDIGGVRDNLTCPPWFRVDANIIQTILDVLDLLGVPGRFIDTASFEALILTTFAGSNWTVSRYIDKDSKVDAVKLLEELSALAGVFIVPQANGVITPVVYDPTVIPTIELLPDVATFAPVQLGQADLFTRQQILYNPYHKNDLTTGIAWGTWDNGGLYLFGNVVIDPLTGNIYHCSLQHYASEDTQPGYGAAWRAYWYRRWATGTVYSTAAPTLLASPDKYVVSGDVVYSNSAVTPSGTYIQPGVTSGWASYWVALSILQPGGLYATTILPAGYSSLPTDLWLWQPNENYAKADSVYRATSGVLIMYRCLQAHNSGSGAPGSNPLEPAIGTNRRAYWATEWVSGSAYVPGDVVTQQGPLFYCILNHTSAAKNEPTLGFDPATNLSYLNYWYSDPVVNSDNVNQYYNAFILINNNAEINWGLNADVPPGDSNYQVNPGYQKNWFDNWNATPYALQQLANRMDSWYANPLMKIKASEVPPSYYAVTQGMIIGVSGLMLPSAGAVWGTPCDMKPFLVMSKTFDPIKCTLAFDLMEIPVSSLTADSFPGADVSIGGTAGSNMITISGIPYGTPISIAGASGEYSINGGTFTSANGTINSGDTLQLLGVASMTLGATVFATVTVGSISATFPILAAFM